MELPLRSNDPLALLTGVNQRKNVFTGSRPRSREASAVQRTTLPPLRWPPEASRPLLAGIHWRKNASNRKPKAICLPRLPSFDGTASSRTTLPVRRLIENLYHE
ncbi:MAG: hypothetical protein LBQ54_05920 [Planctomycetaceae bacterium]|nr:hypothetical protein [Planctomycetaceae bacterium]